MNPEARVKSGLSQLSRIPRVRLGAVVALAVAVAFVVWLLLRGGAQSSAQSTTPTAQSLRTGASVKSLISFAASLGHPIYWVGPKAGYMYELTRTSDDRVFIRYLPRGVRIGARRPFLTVATYPYPNALRALRAAARGGGFTIAGGGLALVHKGYRESVHVAYPGLNYQIEVYDPSPRVSRQLVASGRVQPVG